VFRRVAVGVPVDPTPAADVESVAGAAPYLVDEADRGRV
jgi:hypothetical protein